MVEQLSTYATYDPATQQWKPKDPTAYRVMTEGTKVTVESVPETYTTYRDMKKANTPHEDWHKGNFIRTTYVFVDGSLREELVRDSYALDKGGNLYKEGVYTKYERSYQDGQVRETENVLVSHQTKGGRTKNKVQSRQRYYEKIDQATAQKEAERKAKKLAEQDPLYEVTYKGRTYSTKSRDFVPLAAKQDRARYEQELLAIPKGTRLAPEKVRIGTIELSPRFMDKVNQSFEEQYPIPTRKRAAIDAGYTSFLGDLALSDKAAPQFRTALGLLAIEQQVSEIRMGAFARPQVAQQDQSFIPPGAKKAFSVWADTSSKASFLFPWPSIAARKKTYNLLVEKGKPVIGFAVEKLTQYDAFVEKEFDITQKVQAGDKSYYANPLYALAQKNDRARNVLLGVSAGGKLLLKYPPLFAAGEIRFGFEVGATRGKVITDTAAEIKKSLNTAGGRQQLGGMVLTLAAPWGVSTLGRARTAKASTGADQALQKGKGLTTRERVIESPIEGFGTPQLRLSDIGSLLSTSQRKAVRKALMRATEEIMIEVSPGPKGQLKGRRLPVEPQYKALRYLEGPRAKPRKTTEAVVTEARWRAAVEERALGRPAAHKVKAIKQRVKGGELPEAKLLTATTKRKGRSTLLEFSIPKGSGIDRLYNALVRPKRRRGRITGGPERFDILPFLDKGPLRPKPRKSIHAVISEVRWQEAVAERATLRAEKAKVKAIKQRVRGGETVGGDLFIQATKRKGRSKLVEINARTDGIFDKVFDSIRRPKRRRGRITGGPERYDLLKVLPRNEDLILVFDKQKPAKAIFKDFFPEEGTKRKKGSPGPPPKKMNTTIRSCRTVMRRARMQLAMGVI